MKKLTYGLFIFATIALVACGGNKDTDNAPDEEPTTSSTENGGGESTDDEPKNLAEAMQQAQKAMEDSGMGNQAEVVNFRELQNHLPEKLAGMERTSKGGQTAGAMGMTVSTAEAKYKTSDGTEVEITLADTGGLGMGLMGLAAWSTVEVDKEDENGSERTAMLDGYKSFEKTRNRDQSCELSIIAEGRYVVTAECRQCKMDVLKKAVREMDLGDLPKGGKK